MMPALPFRNPQNWKARGGLGCILMELTFPNTYPTDPFFLRIIKPRCVMYSGHVTVRFMHEDLKTCARNQ